MGTRLGGRSTAGRFGLSLSRRLAILATSICGRFFPTRRSAGLRFFRPCGEQFESRQLLSTLTWTGNGSSDSFNDPLNWVVTAGDDLGATRVPTSADDAIINAASNRSRVQVTGASASVHSISSADGIGKPFEVLSGYTLTIAAASTFQSTLLIGGGTITGNGVVTVVGAMTWNGGTIMDSDSAISTVFNVNGGLTLSGSTKSLTGRTLQLNSNSTWTGGTIALNSAIINNAPGVEFDIHGVNLRMTTSLSSQFVNSGTVARSPGTENTATMDAPFTNTATGTINVRSGTLKLSAPPGNLISGVLTGGTYILNGTLLLPSIANITTNAASIILDGSNAKILAGTPSALANFATNSSTGSFTIENGADFSTSGPFSNAGAFAVQDSTTFTAAGAFTNTGSVKIGNASTLSVGGGANYTQTAGSTKLADSTSVLAVGALADIQAGSISGFGKIQGSLTSSGQLSPGDSPGQLTVTGNYTQNSAAALNIEIGGLTPGSQADQLVVNGALALGGALNVSLINGYVPTAGDKFRIVSKTSFGAIGGTFAGLPEGATFKVGQVPFQITYLADLNNNNVELTVLQPTVSVDPIALNEGDAGTKAFDVPVRLSFKTNKPVSVTVNTSDGSAMAPADYTAVANQVVTFNPGETLKTLTVQVNGDTTKEPDETIAVNLSNVAGPAILGDGPGVITILNDDTLPAVSIADASLTEGDTGDTALHFTISLTAAAAAAVSGTFSTADGTATGGADFVAQTAAAWSIPAGQSTATVEVPIHGDFLIEGPDTFTVSLANLSNGLAGRMTATGTILDDDSRVVTIADAQLAEGDSGTQNMTFTILVNQARGDGPITGTFSTTSGTATSDLDYTSQANIAWTIPAGQTSTTISVPIIGDALIEGPETFTVTLANVVGADAGQAVGGDPTALGTILDDDHPQLSISDASTLEGNLAGDDKRLKFTVSLSAAIAEDVTVHVSTEDGSAVQGEDFVALSNLTVTIPANQRSATFQVEAVEDFRIESDEQFAVNLSSPSANVRLDPAHSSATGTILNDDDRTLSITSTASALEGNTAADDRRLNFQVTLSQAIPEDVTVLVDTSDLSAAANQDYVPLSGFLVTIPANQTTANLPVAIVGDLDAEGDETLGISLRGASPNARIEPSLASGVGTITDDDFLRFSIDDVSQREGNSGAAPFTFTVSLAANPLSPVAVKVNTADGTATTADDDYSALSGLVLTFNPGDSRTQTVTVNASGDTKFEDDQTFTVNLSDPTGGATISKSQGLATLQNDDSRPTISIHDRSVPETNESFSDVSFDVTLSNASDETVTVQLDTADGTATAADNDYVAVVNRLITFTPGSTEQQTAVSIHGDAKYETDEQFFLNLTNLSNTAATGNRLQAVGEIVNDDAAPTISIDDVSKPEGDSGAAAFTFTVSLSNPSFKTVTLTYQTADGILNAARASRDYSAIELTPMTFNPGETSQAITVLVNGDTFFEPNETFFVNLSDASNASLADGQGLGTITNDDPAGPPPLYPAAVKDDGQTGYLERGNWTSASGGFLGDVRTHAGGMGTSTAVWSLSVTPGSYQIFTTWAPAADRATSAPYAVYIDGISQGPAVLLNQQLTPDDGSFDNRLWKSLGTFAVVAGDIAVQLSDSAHGVVAADGVIAVPIAGGGSDLPPDDSGPASLPPLLSLDANNDGFIAPSDALIVINYLNSKNQTALGPAGLGGAFSIDVNADQYISPLDALLVINDINSRSRPSSGEGEAADTVFSRLGASEPADGILWRILSLDPPSGQQKRR